MGINLRAREAEEKSKAAFEAVGHLIGVTKKQELMLNALSQMIYEMSQRQAAMEVVMDHVLGLQGLNAKDIIEAYVASQEQARVAAEAEAAASNESAVTETPTELVGVPESTDQAATT